MSLRQEWIGALIATEVQHANGMRDNRITPGLLVRHQDDLTSVGLVVSVSGIDATVLWSKDYWHNVNMNQHIINNVRRQIQEEEDSEILRILTSEEIPET